MLDSAGHWAVVGVPIILGRRGRGRGEGEGERGGGSERRRKGRREKKLEANGREG